MIKTRLAKRIIPLILFQDFQVVKSIQYSKFRVVGNFEQTIEVFNIRDVDEIIILDIEASSKKKNVDLEVLKILSKNANMPFSYGGGVKNLSDIEKTLKAGADKVIINNIALNKINFISEASKRFGSQCIVVAIDAKKVSENKWEIFTHGGRNKTGIDAVEFAKKVEDNGAGEILLTSMDKDGTKSGYDVDLLKKITNTLNIPLIASGGVGTLDHFYDGIVKGGASAVLAASIFHYGEYKIKEAKEYLNSKNVSVRL